MWRKGLWVIVFYIQEIYALKANTEVAYIYIYGRTAEYCVARGIAVSSYPLGRTRNIIYEVCVCGLTSAFHSLYLANHPHPQSASNERSLSLRRRRRRYIPCIMVLFLCLHKRGCCAVSLAPAHAPFRSLACFYSV